MVWRESLRRTVKGFSLGMLAVSLLFLLLTQLVSTAVFGRLREANREFSDAAGRGALTIFPEILAGYLSGTAEPVAASRWLVLGKDEVEGSGRQAVLTDTMLVVSYRPVQGRVSLLPLPRDWYHPELATKINALLSYGLKRDPSHPTILVQDTVGEMLGLPLDHVVELSLADVSAVIDLIGGLEIDVRRAFSDERFPRAGVDVTRVSDPKLLYETINFQSGPQLMDGATALKFMRSRYSSDLEEGNDEARVRRQQQVIEALANSLQSPRIVGNARILGSLYRWYADRFQKEVSLFELGRMAGSLAKSKKVPEMIKLELPVTNQAVATESATLLVHPPTEKYGQWVYEAEDLDFSEIHDFMRVNDL
jgi:LCP family protein required for cell wall assembly